MATALETAQGDEYSYNNLVVKRAKNMYCIYFSTNKQQVRHHKCTGQQQMIGYVGEKRIIRPLCSNGHFRFRLLPFSFLSLESSGRARFAPCLGAEVLPSATAADAFMDFEDPES